MMSRQPSHRIATLSETIVRIVTPWISIQPRIPALPPPAGRLSRGARSRLRQHEELDERTPIARRRRAPARDRRLHRRATGLDRPAAARDADPEPFDGRAQPRDRSDRPSRREGERPCPVLPGRQESLVTLATFELEA